MMTLMRGWSSAFVHIVARVLVLALSTAALGPLLHEVHVEDCEPIFVVHDPSQHRFTAPATDPADGGEGDHCVACHFARSSRGPVSWEAAGLEPLQVSGVLVHADGPASRAASAGPLPARAPPVTLA